MKQLFLLVTKYIRRQRFRTTLTFLCVLLSVFVFNLLCDAFVVIRGVMITSRTQYDGEWEADITSLIRQTADNKKALETVKNSQAVERYYMTDGFLITNEQMYRDKEGYQSYLEFTVNGGKPVRTAYANQEYHAGDRNVLGAYGYWGAVSFEDMMKGGIVLPTKFQKDGFKVGDQVTVSLSALRAKLPDDQPALREKQQEMIKQYQDAVGTGTKYRLYRDSQGDEESEYLYDTTLFSAASLRGILDELVVEDVHRSEPYTFTTTILAFETVYSSGFTLYADTSEIDISKCLNGEFESVKLGADSVSQTNPYYSESFDYYLDDLDSDEGKLSCHQSQSALIVTNQNMDFDDAMEALYGELDLPADDMNEKLHPVRGMTSDGVYYNQELLMLRFRGSDSYALWFDSLDKIIFLAVAAVVALLVWALMRFVIDNAFEISVQERSAQFATLRIMGASRRQIGIVVGLEAMFYCIVSIPLGMLLSYICRASVFSSLEEYGFHVKETSFPALSVVAAVLALTAVLVSSYTSSMWAARAYSPLENAKKTKLKGNKKESFWSKDIFGGKSKKDKKEEKAERRAMPTGDLKKVRRSKLNRKQKSFLRNYSMRNIRRTRSRFVISVISMSLGTMLFAFGLTIGIATWWSLQPYYSVIDNTSDFDFAIADKADQVMTTVQKLAKYVDANAQYFQVDKEISFPLIDNPRNTAQIYEAVSDKLESDYKATDMLLFEFVDEQLYQQKYAEITGMDYKTFMEKGGVLVDENLCGSYYQWEDRNEDGVRIPKKTGRESSFVALTGKTAALSVEYYDTSETDAADIYALEYGEWYHETASENMADLKMKTVETQLVGLMKRESDKEDLGIVVSYDTLLQLFEDVFNKKPTNAMIGYSLKLNENKDYQAVRDALYELRGEYEQTNNVFFVDNYKESTGLFSVLNTILTIGSIALAAVWLTGIFTMLNTVNTSVLNRAEELSMLRMIGMSRKMMRKTVLMESSIYCEFSTMIGGLLGVSGSLYMMTAMDFFGSEDVEMVFVTFGIVLAAVIISNFLISRVAALPSLHTLKRHMDSGRMMQ